MEDKVLWGPSEGLLVSGKISVYDFVLPTAQMVGGFVYKMIRPTMKQAIMTGEHGVLTVINDDGQMWLKVPLRKVPLESDTFATKLDNKAPMSYVQHRLYEMKEWRGKIEFIDFPTTGWSASDSPIISKKKWSEFPGEVRLLLGVICRPVVVPR